jgi:hypothetical protein
MSSIVFRSFLVVATLLTGIAEWGMSGSTAQAVERKINKFTASAQTRPAIARLKNGQYIVAWESAGQDGDGGGIFARRLRPSGGLSGAPFPVNTKVMYSQRTPAVAGLSNGGFVVVWASDDDFIWGQRFTAEGIKSGVQFKISGAGSKASAPAVAAYGDNFVVVWSTSTAGVIGQRYANTGLKAGVLFTVNTGDFDTDTPAVTGLNNGGFAVVWVSEDQDTDGAGVYGQRFQSNGAKAGKEFGVNKTTTGEQYAPTIASVKAGFVVAWSNGTSMTHQDVLFRRYSITGVAQGPQVRANKTTLDTQKAPDIAGLPSGGFFIVWTSYSQDGGDAGVFGQTFSANGKTTGNEFRVNTKTAGDQQFPTVAAHATKEEAVVTWESFMDGDIYADHFDLKP